MNILLLIISIIFASIFYLFNLAASSNNFFSINYLDSLSGNLIIESISFLLIGFFLFFGFSNFSLEKDKEIKQKKQINFNFGYFSELIQSFLKKYLYYIGLILAYSSFYFILKYFGYTDFSYFILTLNLVVLILFFITYKFLLFRDFIKINTIIFSIYYIFIFILSFFDSNIILSNIDNINTILIFIFFLLTFYNDKSILKINKSDFGLVVNFFVYCLLFLTFYLNNYFEFLAVSLLYTSTFLFSFIYFFIIKLKFFNNNQKILKIISIIISYISGLSGLYLLHNNSYFFISNINTIYIIIFNLYIHYKYQNYISLGFGLFSILYLIFNIYFQKLFYFDDGLMFLGLGLALSSEFIIYTYFYKLKYSFDYYFVHIFSYLITIFVIVYYFYAFSFDLLTLGIILLVCSIIAFLSYFKLKQINIK